MVRIRGREYDQQITERHSPGEEKQEEKVSGLFSGELGSDKMPRWEDQDVQTKRVGFITP
jgi:hypothetical protein